MANVMSFMDSMSVKKSAKNDGMRVRVDLDKLEQDIANNSVNIFQGKKGRYLSLWISPRKAQGRYGETHYVSILPLASAESDDHSKSSAAVKATKKASK